MASRLMSLLVATAMVFASMTVGGSTVFGADEIRISFSDYEVELTPGEQEWGYASLDTDIVEFKGSKSGSNVLLIEDPDNVKAPFATVDIDLLKKGYVEFWIMPLQNDGRLQIILDDREDNSNRMRIETLGFRDNQLIEYEITDGRMYSEKTYSKDQWYRFLIEIDAGTKTKNIHVFDEDDNIILKEETGFRNPDANGLTHLRFTTITASYGSFYIDNIVIGKGDTPASKYGESKVSQPSTPPTAMGEAGFSDLDGHWAKADIELLAGKDIVLGTSAGKFAPNAAITRGDFTGYLVRGLGLEEETTSEFTDVKANDWYAGAIGAAVKAGLIQGMGNNEFQPTANITREQMAVIFSRALKSLEKQPNVSANQIQQLLNHFVDHKQISDWANEEVAYIVEAKIITGTPDNEFLPQNNATRAEGTVMLKRFLDFVGK